MLIADMLDNKEIFITLLKDYKCWDFSRHDGQELNYDFLFDHFVVAVGHGSSPTSTKFSSCKFIQSSLFTPIGLNYGGLCGKCIYTVDSRGGFGSWIICSTLVFAMLFHSGK